jgi:hypothetical protein
MDGDCRDAAMADGSSMGRCQMVVINGTGRLAGQQQWRSCEMVDGGCHRLQWRTPLVVIIDCG